MRIPADVPEPGARITIAPLCRPELYGHALLHASINPLFVGRDYRYVYGNCATGSTTRTLTASCRIDVTDGSVVMFHDLPRAVPAGIPVFVPRPGAAPDDETDGVVLLDYLGIDGRALVYVLDGRGFAEIARVTVPYRHCMSLHNSWVWG